MMELYEKYVGLVFDNRYRIERVIGIGGMAIVFKATDLLMRRVVAVKILKDEISEDEQSVKDAILEDLQEMFGSDFIVGVSFSSVNTQ